MTAKGHIKLTDFGLSKVGIDRELQIADLVSNTPYVKGGTRPSRLTRTPGQILSLTTHLSFVKGGNGHQSVTGHQVPSHLVSIKNDAYPRQIPTFTNLPLAFRYWAHIINCLPTADERKTPFGTILCRQHICHFFVNSVFYIYSKDVIRRRRERIYFDTLKLRS